MRLAGLTADTLGYAGPRQAEAKPEDDSLRLRDTFYAEQQQEAVTEDPALTRYIEAELAKRREAASGGTPAAEAGAEPGAPRAGRAQDDGTERWMSGSLQEVELPLEYKLRVRCGAQALLRGARD